MSPHPRWFMTPLHSTGGNAASGTGPQTTARILLVDDEEVLRQLAMTILSRQGYAVVEAAGPSEALEIGDASPASFDLILADVMMPGMRGWEMVERLRPSQPKARVLYMSGYVGELDTSALQKVRPLIAKPFKPRDLIAEVQRVLGETQ